MSSSSIPPPGSATKSRGPDLPAVFRARVVRVIDGDTVVFDVDLRFGVGLRVTSRLFGINAPEMHGATAEAGRASKAALEDLLLRLTFKDGPYPYVVVKSHKAAEEQDKYGRWLFEIVGGDGGENVNLNEEMVKRGLAVSYLP